MMHDDFLQDHPNLQCSYNAYRKEISKKMNISFATLGEECEPCLAHKMSNHEHERKETCKTCENWKNHEQRAQLSRQEYKKDSEFDWPTNVSVRSVDMQKISMFPCIPGVKTIAFTKRIIAFHKTFAAVGTKPKLPHISIVWHEALVGRSSSEIASCFETVIRFERDISSFIFWVDNCSSQNKNWCLFSSLTTTSKFAQHRSKGNYSEVL